MRARDHAGEQAERAESDDADLGARLDVAQVDRVQRDGEVPWMSLSSKLPDRRLWSSAPDTLMRKHRFVPIEMDKYFLTVGMVDPQDGAALEAIRQSFSGVRFRVVAVSVEDFERFVSLATTKTAAGRSGDAVMVPPEGRPSVVFVEEDETRSAALARANELGRAYFDTSQAR